MEERQLNEMYQWIGQMKTDIEWLKENVNEVSTFLHGHIEDSDKYRNYININTAWRKAYFWVIGASWVAIGTIVTIHLTK